MPTYESQEPISVEDEPLSVRVTGRGRAAVIEISGHDVSQDLAAYALTQQAGDVPRMVIELSPKATATGVFEGLAHVVIGDPPDTGPAAADFLSAISPAELEKAALGRHDLMDGRPHELTRAMLALLREWALGQWDGAAPTDGE
ncbi:hypothetical protein GR925_01490 [Streptomyces sp. HUCO-GS316]|uniref:hypothetical protein n=1 Tax=Streptomyces sp. HUCO-GS316 TaxID=2692198 RepID=UPI001370A26E|nr:hypothetical protein [Streptomyces sp. HUCO-GS316]MXM62156.1 hypothetical protein [Streptomyces sp. HUCO-GS316]